LNQELGKRRNSFFQKIEESTDKLIFTDIDLKNAGEAAPESSSFFAHHADNHSIDDLLLNALYAHNRGLFDDAIKFYTKIFDLNPEKKTSALIYKHRGMAYFAQSKYSEAISDFQESFRADSSSYKSLYYQGIVNSVLQNYGEAVANFNASLSLYPYQSYCLYRKAQALFHLEDFTESLAACEHALQITPDFKEAMKLKEMLLNKLKM
jgi:putative GTP pyrophosphokinase